MITNVEAIKRFTEYSNRFQKIAVSIKNPIESLREAEKSVVREELCSGSDMFLGYYCPSLIFDLVVGNVHRGKILQRVTKQSKPTHRYGFDKANRLRTVVEIADEDCKDFDNRSILLYKDHSVIIIHINHFEETTELDVLVECLYDSENRLEQYTMGLMNHNRCQEITQEIYCYSNRELDTATLWKCGDLPSGGHRLYVPQIDTYRFHHDADGYITSYETVGNDFWDGTIFEVPEKKRRKL